ncbi:MAG: AAA family ATPase, partial [Rugosibacter sp.]|nr:AAA family ATPase [Rugosibacter sp.]
QTRETWIAVCAALCRSGEPGFQLFHEWSKTAPNDGKHGYQGEADCRAKFLEMAPRAKSAPEAIFTMATERGWINKPTGATAPTGFRFIPLRELADSTVNPHWVVKHWLERDTVTCIAGQPKHGKSFSAFDIGLHVAAGIPWCGKRVEQGAVFVIAGEGQGGTSRRTKGWLLKHPEVSKDIPFYVSNKSIQLNTTGAEKSKTIIEDMCKVYGVAPSMIIVDTLARSFPGDENKTEDMNTFVAALDQHLKVMDVALVIVHHSTKSGSDVLRGNSALRGALDGLIEVTKAKTPSPTGGILIEVKPHWLKDGQTPTSLFFNCEVVKTGIDEDFEDITTLVPILTSQPGAAAASLTNIERQALDILRGLQSEDGNIGVPLKVWRNACFAAELIAGQTTKAIVQNMDRLVLKGLSATDSIFKPGGRDGKYRAVIYASFDIETPD